MPAVGRQIDAASESKAGSHALPSGEEKTVGKLRFAGACRERNLQQNAQRVRAAPGREKPIEIPAEYRLQNILFVILQGVMCAPPPRAAEITSFQALSKPESPTKLPAEPGRSHRAQNAPEEP